MRSRLGLDGRLRIGFEPSLPKGLTYVPRTHPLVEAIGGNVVVVPGDPRNLKITGPADLMIAAALLEVS